MGSDMVVVEERVLTLVQMEKKSTPCKYGLENF